MSEPVIVQDSRPTEDAPPRATARADVAWVLGSYAGLGVLGAFLWWLLWDPAYFTVGPLGGLGMGEVELSRRFGADGWYAVIAFVAGLLSGGALTWWRARDPLLTAVLLLLGSGLAAGLMTVLGRWLGPADPATLVADAAVGDRLPTQLEVTATVCHLVWPIAVLAGALLVLWSPSTDVRGLDGPRP